MQTISSKLLSAYSFVTESPTLFASSGKMYKFKLVFVKGADNNRYVGSVTIIDTESEISEQFKSQTNLLRSLHASA